MKEKTRTKTNGKITTTKEQKIQKKKKQTYSIALMSTIKKEAKLIIK